VSKTFDDLPEESIVKILSFLPSRALLTTVSRVSWTLNRLVNDSSLWNHVHFHFGDSPEYIAKVLARFRNSIRKVTLKSSGVQETKNLNVLVESNIAFEEVHLVAADDCSRDLDLSLLFQLIGESTKIFSFRQLDFNRVFLSAKVYLSPDVHVLPKTQLLALDLSTMYSSIDDRMIEVIVTSCPQLQSLDTGQFGDNYTSVGIRAIADGLPNLASVSLSGWDDCDESFRYLLSRKPCLSAFGLGGLAGAIPRTAAQISRMGHLQYLRLGRINLDGKTMRAMFENAHFGQLKTLRLDFIQEFDSVAMKAMALACPKLEQLSFSGEFEPPHRLTDDIVEFLFNTCPELRVFYFLGLKETLTGEGWLGNVGTLLSRVQCLAFTLYWGDKPSSEFLRRADLARSRNPKLSILVDGTARPTDHRYNERVTVSATAAREVLNHSMPRPCDLEARRVRHPNVLLEAAHLQLAKSEACPQPVSWPLANGNLLDLSSWEEV
jgi:hypothetical protein